MIKKKTLSGSQGTEVAEIGKRCSVLINLLLQLNRVGVKYPTARGRLRHLGQVRATACQVQYKWTAEFGFL